MALSSPSPNPVAALSKAWVCGRSFAGIGIPIPPRAWMFVPCECCVLSGWGFRVGLITRPEGFYLVWCVWVWSWGLDNDHGPLGTVAPWKKTVVRHPPPSVFENMKWHNKTMHSQCPSKQKKRIIFMPHRFFFHVCLFRNLSCYKTSPVLFLCSCLLSTAARLFMCTPGETYADCT